MSVTAADLLAVVAPFGVIGINLPDLADPTTWIFQPELDATTRAQAIAAIQARLLPALALVTKRAFFALIAPAEYLAVVQAAAAGDALCTYGLAVLQAVSDIDVTDPLVGLLLDHLVTTAILTADRAQAIRTALQAVASGTTP